MTFVKATRNAERGGYTNYGNAIRVTMSFGKGGGRRMRLSLSKGILNELEGGPTRADLYYCDDTKMYAVQFNAQGDCKLTSNGTIDFRLGEKFPFPSGKTQRVTEVRVTKEKGVVHFSTGKDWRTKTEEELRQEALRPTFPVLPQAHVNGSGY